MKVTILGCGGSGGVPVANGTPGGDWGVCDPTNPRNRRRRVSILVQRGQMEEGGTAILLDTSPDLRDQLIDAGVEDLSAVLYTHAHADHCHGLDELRGLVQRRRAPLDAYMSAETRAALTTRFAYAFSSSRDPQNLYRPMMRDRVIDGPFQVGDVRVVPFVQNHGPEDTLGFRLDDVAYTTDAVALDEAAFEVLAGVRLWVVDCLRDDPHPTHSWVAQTFAWIERVKPERAVLTHMNHQIDYEDLKARCPAGVEPGYDGLVIEV